MLRLAGIGSGRESDGVMGMVRIGLAHLGQGHPAPMEDNTHNSIVGGQDEFGMAPKSRSD